MNHRRIVLPGRRWRVTLVTRPGRAHPYQLRITDRMTGLKVHEVLRGIGLRDRKRAYAAAAAREVALNEAPGGAAAAAVEWPEARRRLQDRASARAAWATRALLRQTLDRLERFILEISGRPIRWADQVDVTAAERFVAWRKAGGAGRPGVGGVTVNKDLRTLRAAWNALAREGAVASNPWQAVPNLKVMERIKTRLTGDQVRRLVRESSKGGTRFEACLAMALDTGMRSMELSHLSWQHVDLSGRTATVAEEACGWRPKDFQERRLRFSERTAGLLQELKAAATAAAVRAGGLTPDEAWQVLGRRRVFGQSGTARTDVWDRRFNRALQEACGRAGVPEVTCHGLRRSVARIAREAGAEGRDVQALLGHSSFSTTQSYIGDDQAEASARAFEALEGGRRADAAGPGRTRRGR